MADNTSGISEPLIAEETKKKRISDRIASSATQGSTRDALVADIARGSSIGENVLGEEGLGRLGTDVDIQGILEKQRSLAEQGLSAEEFAAQRSQAFEGIDRQTQTSSRELQASLARAGVKGASAGSQLANIQREGLRSKAGVERDIFNRSADIKRQEFANFRQNLASTKAFDLEQAAREKELVLGTGVGFGEIGSAERIASKQGRLSEVAQPAAPGRTEVAAKAAAKGGLIGGVLGAQVNVVKKIFCHHEDTEVFMADGSLKRIGDIKLGDQTSGGRVNLISKMYSIEDMYEFKGEIMTGSHWVMDINGNWAQVRDLGESSRRSEYDKSVICPIETDTGIYMTKAEYISGDLSAEYNEMVEKRRNHFAV